MEIVEQMQYYGRVLDRRPFEKKFVDGFQNVGRTDLIRLCAVYLLTTNGYCIVFIDDVRDLLRSSVLHNFTYNLPKRFHLLEKRGYVYIGYENCNQRRMTIELTTKFLTEFERWNDIISKSSKMMKLGIFEKRGGDKRD